MFLPIVRSRRLAISPIVLWMSTGAGRFFPFLANPRSWAVRRDARSALAWITSAAF
jgi:hypothetical protein